MEILYFKNVTGKSYAHGYKYAIVHIENGIPIIKSFAKSLKVAKQMVKKLESEK